MRFTRGRVLTLLRCIQALFAVIIIITGAVSSAVGANGRVSFLLFAAVWTVFALAYLVMAPNQLSNNVWFNYLLSLPAEALTCLFYLAGFIALASQLTSSCSISTSSDNQQPAELMLFKQYVVTSCRADQAVVIFASFQFALFGATFSYNCWTWYWTTETATAKREQRGPTRRQSYYDEFFNLPRLPRLPNMSPLKLASEDIPPETPPNTRKSVCPKDSLEAYQFSLGFSQLDSTNQVPVDSSRISVPPAHRFSEIKTGFSYTKTDSICYIPDFGAVDNEQTEPFDAAKDLGRYN